VLYVILLISGRNAHALIAVVENVTASTDDMILNLTTGGILEPPRCTANGRAVAASIDEDREKPFKNLAGRA